MTALTLIGELERAGFDARDAASRATLLTAAARRLSDVTGREPTGAWFVPGRVEIVGKHMDYTGGASLVAALPRGMAVVVAPRADGRVRVIDARYDGEVDLLPGEDGRTFSGWMNYVAVVARRLAANFPGADLGADIAIASDLPRAAGLSSSSVLVVSIAHALASRAGLPARADWQAAIGDGLHLSDYLGAIENGRTFGPLAETAGVGTEGGSQDPTAILASRHDAVTAFRYAPVRLIEAVPVPADWRFVIMTSGVHAGKAGDVRDRFNRVSRAARALLSLWQAASGLAETSLGAIVASHPDAASMLQTLAARGHGDFPADELRRRLAHFVGEQSRASDAVAAFRDADAVRIGELAFASQRAAEDDLGNQVHETRELARTAVPCGALAATSFGAGFGGSVWALVSGDDGEAARVAAAWARAYASVCPHAAGSDWFVARPAPAFTAVQW